MNLKEYFYILFFLFFVLFSSYGCDNGTKNQKKGKSSVKKKTKGTHRKKVVVGKNADNITHDKNENDRQDNKDAKTSRKSVKPPRFYPDVNQMKYDNKKDKSLKVDKTQSKPLSLKDSKKNIDKNIERNKNTSDTNKLPLDKTLPSNRSEVTKTKIKDTVLKEHGKNSIIEGGLQSSRKELKIKNDEEMSNPDLNKETKDETTNMKDKITDVTKEPSQAYTAAKKEKQPDEPKPKKIALDEKEKLIATGAIAKKKKTDYPTMDDVLSDWDTEKEKAGQTLAKDALTDNGQKPDNINVKQGITNQPDTQLQN
uniref:Lipoprotein n=1 Tax=Strongyloides stercoralis TaxID=6248 RepID=A0A0K0DYJ0_STRER